MSSPPKSNRFQQKVRRLYLKLFEGVKSDEAKLKVLQAFGEFAMQNYTGHFREPELEDFLTSYGKRKFKIKQEPAPLDENALVHIITRTYTIGGHSRFLENILQIDKKHRHHLIVTDQGETPYRKSIHELIEYEGGRLIFLDGDLDEKGQQLIDALTQLGGKILLHHHPSDILPSISLSVLQNRYPVYLFNHADHCYSYGFELDPSVVNIREEAARITFHWRQCEKNAVLPLPIIKPEIKLSREEVFTMYGLNPDLKLGLCVAGIHKFLPVNEQNFFQIFKSAIEQNPDFQVAVVGVRKERLIEMGLEKYFHPNFHFLGLVQNPSELQAHADIAIDPIPNGSYTALLEASHYGAYPLIRFGAPALFNLANDPALKNLYSISTNQVEYLQEINNALKYHNLSSKEDLSKSIQQYHSGTKWTDSYMKLMNTTLLSNTKLPTPSMTLPVISKPHDSVIYSVNKLLKQIRKEINLSNLLSLTFSLFNIGFGIKSSSNFLFHRMK